ncbi:phospholipid scramblase 2-like [Physella acuta]|uniref:phospholipid scramblase 2-like n=1 Tax=Physella acuta TaxID=109671 RepID=UPI0027DAFD4A|nr:phospholipid scramblase 2-like [Physella acuta]
MPSKVDQQDTSSEKSTEVSQQLSHGPHPPQAPHAATTTAPPISAHQDAPQPILQQPPQPILQQPPQPILQQPPQPILQQPPQANFPPPPPGPVVMIQEPVAMVMASGPPLPQGLEYLSKLNQVIIKQDVELLEAIVGFETQNSYKLFNSAGQQCYSAFEKSNCCARQCCGNNRCFEMIVTDNFNQMVFSVYRPYKFCKYHPCCACCGICQDDVRISAPDSSPLGKVHQRCSIIKPRYYVLDHNSQSQCEIVGPICQCTLCCKSVEFTVRSIHDHKKIGAISKYRGDIIQELFTDADTFGVTFPIDLDVRTKATLIGAVFLIDFMFFEDPPKQKVTT